MSSIKVVDFMKYHMILFIPNLIYGNCLSYIYISEKIEVFLGSIFSRIINFVSTGIIIFLFLSFRKVPDQTFSKEIKNDTNKNSHIYIYILFAVSL